MRHEEPSITQENYDKYFAPKMREVVAKAKEGVWDEIWRLQGNWGVHGWLDDIRTGGSWLGAPAEVTNYREQAFKLAITSVFEIASKNKDPKHYKLCEEIARAYPDTIRELAMAADMVAVDVEKINKAKDNISVSHHTDRTISVRPAFDPSEYTSVIKAGDLVKHSFLNADVARSVLVGLEGRPDKADVFEEVKPVLERTFKFEFSHEANRDDLKAEKVKSKGGHLEKAKHNEGRQL